MPTRPLRALALHGAAQNAELFSKKVGDLQKKLSGVAELIVAAEGPFAMQKVEAEGLPFDENLTDDPSKRTWFHGNGKAGFWKEARGLESCEWNGIDESMQLLEKVWSTGDFDGLLGFSQGGEVAGIFSSYLAMKGLRLPSFVVCLNGGFKPTPSNLSYYPPTDPLDIPALLVAGAQDVVVTPSNNAAMAVVFKNAELAQHSQKHVLPEKAKDCVPIKDFLGKCQKENRSLTMGSNQIAKPIVVGVGAANEGAFKDHVVACRVCDGTGRLLSDCCPLCDGKGMLGDEEEMPGPSRA
jgi:hypothetical protein